MPNHPIYEKIKAERETAGERAWSGSYVDTADVAKLIRSQLKAKFPKTKFSVRIDRYAGGSSTRISWVDGPTAKLVDAVVKPYAGGGFDGMIDMAYSVDSYLMPDGSASFAQTTGTEGSMGTVPAAKAWKPHPEAIRVRFSGRYVFTEREYSRAALERVLQSYAHRHADELADAIKDGRVHVTDGDRPWIAGAGSISVNGEWGDSLLHRHRVDRMLAA